MGWLWPRRILFGDTPEYYNTATMGPYWRSVTDAAVDPTGGFDGGAAITFDTSTGTTAGAQNLGASTPSVIAFPGDYGRPPNDPYHFFLGSMVEIPSNPGSITPLYTVVNAGGVAQLTCCVNTSGYFEVYKGIPGGTGADSLWDSSAINVTVPTGSPVPMLFMGSINQYPSGWFEIWMDSDRVVYISGFDTWVDPDLPHKGLGWCGTDGWFHAHPFGGDGVPEYSDPLRLGGFYAQALTITADGSYSDLTPNTGDAYAAVDDPTPDDATTFIGGAEANLASSFEHDAVGDTRTIYGVSVTARYDGTCRTGLVVNGSQFLDGIAANTPEDTWAVTRAIFETNPATGTKWSRTAINATEALVRTL